MSYSGSVHFENYDRELCTLNANKILSTNINSVNDFKHNSHFLTLPTHSNTTDVAVSPNCNETVINFSAQRNQQSIFPEPIAFSNSMQSLPFNDVPICSSVNNVSKLNNNEFIVTNFQNEDSSSLDGDKFSVHRQKQILMRKENISDTYSLITKDAGKNISLSDMLEYGEKFSTEKDLYDHIAYSSDRESLKETVDVSFTNDIANFQTFPSSPTKVSQDIDFVKDSYEKKFNSNRFPTVAPQPSRTYNYNTYIKEESNEHKHNREVLSKQNVSKNNTSISSIVDSKTFSDSKPHVMTNQRVSESVSTDGQTNSSFQCEQIPAVGVTNTKVFIPNIQQTTACSEECEDFITHPCGSIHQIRMLNNSFTEESSSLTKIQQIERKMTNLLASIKSEDFAHSREVSKVPTAFLENSMDVITSESKSFICRSKQSYDNAFTTGMVVAESASKILSGNTTSEKVTATPFLEDSNKCMKKENDLFIRNEKKGIIKKQNYNESCADETLTAEMSSEFTRKSISSKQTDSCWLPLTTFSQDVPLLLKVKIENSTSVGRLLCENLTSYLESNMEHTTSSERTFTSDVRKIEFGDHEPCSSKSFHAENTSYIPTFITENKENCSSKTVDITSKQNITIPIKIKTENSDSHTTKLVFKRSPFLNTNKDTVQERREKQQFVNDSLVHGSVQSEIKSDLLKLNTVCEKSGSSETEKTSLNPNNHVFGNTVNEDFKDNGKPYFAHSSLPLDYMIEATTAKEGVTNSILQENQFIDQLCSNGCFETSDISNFKANAKELVSSNTLHEKPSQNLPHSASIRKTEDEVRSDFSRQHFSLPGSTLPTNSTTEKFGTGKNQNMATYENISLITSKNILDNPNINATSSKSESPVINQTSLNQNTITPLRNIKENVNDIDSKISGNTSPNLDYRIHSTAEKRFTVKNEKMKQMHESLIFRSEGIPNIGNISTISKNVDYSKTGKAGGIRNMALPTNIKLEDSENFDMNSDEKPPLLLRSEINTGNVENEFHGSHRLKRNTKEKELSVIRKKRKKKSGVEEDKDFSVPKTKKFKEYKNLEEKIRDKRNSVLDISVGSGNKNIHSNIHKREFFNEPSQGENIKKKEPSILLKLNFNAIESNWSSSISGEITKKSVSKNYSYKKKKFDDQPTQSLNVANKKLDTSINTSDAKRNDFKSNVEKTASCDESLFKVNFESRKCSQLSMSSNKSTKLRNYKPENVANSLISNESDCMNEKISTKRDSLTHEREETMDRSVKLCNAINSEINLEVMNEEPLTGNCSKELTEGRSYLHEDQKKTSKNPTQQNPLCDESANNKGRPKLRSHTETEIEKKKSFKCEKCGFTFTNTLRSTFEAHYNNCRMILDIDEYTKYQCYECKLCGFKPMIPSKHAIKKHMLLHSKERQHKCDECGKAFLTKKNLKSHKQCKHSQKPYICTTCGKSYKSKTTAYDHLRKHQNELSEPEFPCDICGKTFNRRQQLKNHYRKHTGEKPYSCVICNKSFRVINEMYRHRRIHSNERPYQCEICGKTFKYREYSLIHKKMHTQCNDYKCNICGKTFNFSANLNQHLRTHEDKRDHVCRLCDKKFKFPHHLRQHEQTHV